MGKTTLTVSEATHARFNEAKAELDELQDAPDHTAESFLNALLDTWEQVGHIPDDGPEAITDALADDEVAVIGTDHALVDELAERLGSSEGVDYAEIETRCERAVESALEARR